MATTLGSRSPQDLIERRPHMYEAVLSGHPYGRGRLRERWHQRGKNGSLRAAVFGVSDGLVSNLALLLGVAGGGVSPRVIVLAGLAGLLAGALSMAAGEYVSMRVQREIFQHMLEIEALEIELLPDKELEELAALFVSKGIPRGAAESLATSLMADPERALDVHAREELGLDPSELGSPWGAALASFATFAVGAVIPLMPFVFAERGPAIVAALSGGGIALASVGGFMAAMTDRSIARGGLRMAAIGLATAGATYIIGSLLGVAAG